MKLGNYRIIAQSISSAISLDEVKEHLKITNGHSDARLLRLIASVTEYAESITGRDLIVKTYAGYLDYFCSNEPIEITKSKIQSITSFEYYINDVLTIFPSTEYYLIDSVDYGFIFLKNGKTYPQTDCRAQAVKITFVSGYGSGDCAIPSLLKHAMLSQITALFKNAGDCIDVGSEQYKSLYTPFIIPSNFFRVI